MFWIIFYVQRRLNIVITNAGTGWAVCQVALGCFEMTVLTQFVPSSAAVSLISLAVVFGLSAAVPVPAEAQAGCGSFYRVKRGDTLRSITIIKLRHERYRDLFNANRDVLDNPSQLETGQLLFIPCRNSGPQTRAAALAKTGRRPSARDNLGNKVSRKLTAQARAVIVAPGASVRDVRAPEATDKTGAKLARLSPPKAANPARVAGTPLTKKRTARGSAADRQSQQPLRMLMASGIAPLTDAALPRGGLLPVLMDEAFKASGVDRQPRNAFVDDRKSHLDVLMPTGAFALAAPWPAPDCTRARPGTESAALCQSFLFSRPLFEIDVVALVRSQGNLSGALDGPSALAGMRICRPLGFTSVDLEQLDAGVTIVRGQDRLDCLSKLLSDNIDIVSIPGPMTKDYGVPGVVEARGLRKTIPVHAVAWAGTPGAQAVIDNLDAGLAKLQQSGAWFTLVASYMSANKIQAKLDQ